MAIDFPASPTLNDVFTVGNVTYVWDGTKWTASVTGGISLDKIEEGNTSAEVIDTGSDGRFVVTTEGTERLRVTNTGLVGIGTNSPSAELSIAGSDPQLVLWEGSDGASSSKVQLGTGLVQGFINIHKGDGTRTVQISSDDTSYFIGGNVGIGTASPTYLCNVIAAAGSQNIFQAGQTGVSNGYTITSNGTNLTHAWFNGGSEAARIDSSGRLGIGTSSPGAAIHVTSSNAGGYGGVIYNTSSTGEGLIIRAGSTSSHNILVAQTYDGSASRFIVNAAGNVGIGTTSPSRLLHLSAADSTSFSSADFDQTYNFLRIVNTTNDKAAGIYFGIGTNGEAAITATETTDGETSLVFGTRGGGTRSERARLDHAGRLLVGTSTAAATYVSLGLQGNGSVATNQATLAMARGSNPSGDSQELGRIEFFNNNSNSGGTIVALSEGAWTTGSSHPTRLVFSTTASGASSSTERMRIRSNGHFRIGQTSTDTPGLGNTTAGIGFEPENGSIFLSRADGASLYLNCNIDADVARFSRSGSAVGTISVTTTTTAYNTSSDYRLKENVTPVSDGITRLQQLKPSRFNFIADPGHTVDGFLAHEAEVVVPEVHHWRKG
jgi:hypothetical protein